MIQSGIVKQKMDKHR